MPAGSLHLKTGEPVKDFRLDMLPLEALRRAAYNPRESLDEFTAEQLQRSILDFGIVEPLVVNARSGNTIVGGHQRFDMLVALTDSGQLADVRVPCVMVDLDERAEMRLNIALNAIVGRWDNEKLRDLFEILDTGEDDAIELVGFSDAEIERIMTSTPDPEEIAALGAGGMAAAGAEAQTITAILRCPVDAWPTVEETIRATCERHGATLDTA